MKNTVSRWLLGVSTALTLYASPMFASSQEASKADAYAALTAGRPAPDMSDVYTSSDTVGIDVFDNVARDRTRSEMRMNIDSDGKEVSVVLSSRGLIVGDHIYKIQRDNIRTKGKGIMIKKIVNNVLDNVFEVTINRTGNEETFIVSYSDLGNMIQKGLEGHDSFPFVEGLYFTLA